MNRYIEDGIKNGKLFNNQEHLTTRLYEFLADRSGGTKCLVCNTEEFAVSIEEAAELAQEVEAGQDPLEVPVRLKDPGKDSFEIACMHCGYRMRFWALPFTWWEASSRDTGLK